MSDAQSLREARLKDGDVVQLIDASFKRRIVSNPGAFAYMKSDGSVISWGKSENGGDSTAVKNDLTSGVQQIYSADRAFAAVKNNGSVITWGDKSCGGDSTGAVCGRSIRLRRRSLH